MVRKENRRNQIRQINSGGTRMHKFLIAAASIAALGLAGPASAQSPIIIKFSHVVATNTPKGMIGLAYWDNGFKQMSANKKLLTPADYKGLKFRIQSSKVLEAQFRTLGVIPQVMAFSEVYQALQTGVVDGQENSWSNIYTQKMHEVQKYITETNHGYIGYVVVTNKKFWDGLPADVRSACEKAMKEATEYGNGQSAKENDDALAEIKKTGKSEIIKLTPEQDAAMRKAVEPVFKEVASRVGLPQNVEFIKEPWGATR